MFDTLSKNEDVEASSVDKLKQYIEKEEYDSDAVRNDVAGQENGNISSMSYDTKMVETLVDFVTVQSCMILSVDFCLICLYIMCLVESLNISGIVVFSSWIYFLLLAVL